MDTFAPELPAHGISSLIHEVLVKSAVVSLNLKNIDSRCGDIDACWERANKVGESNSQGTVLQTQPGETLRRNGRDVSNASTNLPSYSGGEIHLFLQ